MVYDDVGFVPIQNNTTELFTPGEEARVVCQVDANPAPTHFK